MSSSLCDFLIWILTCCIVLTPISDTVICIDFTSDPFIAQGTNTPERKIKKRFSLFYNHRCIVYGYNISFFYYFIKFSFWTKSGYELWTKDAFVIEAKNFLACFQNYVRSTKKLFIANYFYHVSTNFEQNQALTSMQKMHL